MNAEPEPKLAAPGAGLPKLELLAARFIFARYRRRGNRESFNADFQRERGKIGTMVRSCTPEQAARRVLIDRVRGLEDSSRYWSVWMTLDHLRIVHLGILGTIKSLANGIVPPGAASTARVKPGVDVTADVVDEYEKSCDDLLATVAGVADPETPEKFPHPWFGPLNAGSWHALAPNHLAIHRKQIERIIEGL